MQRAVKPCLRITQPPLIAVVSVVITYQLTAVRLIADAVNQSFRATHHPQAQAAAVFDVCQMAHAVIEKADFVAVTVFDSGQTQAACAGETGVKI